MKDFKTPAIPSTKAFVDACMHHLTTAIDRRVTGEIDRVEKPSTVVSDRGA
jgi:hypothetical protein